MHQLTHARVSVFRHVCFNGLPLIEWYRTATDEELLATGQYLVVDKLISEDELTKLLEIE